MRACPAHPHDLNDALGYDADASNELLIAGQQTGGRCQAFTSCSVIADLGHSSGQKGGGMNRACSSQMPPNSKPVAQQATSPAGAAYDRPQAITPAQHPLLGLPRS